MRAPRTISSLAGCLALLLPACGPADSSRDRRAGDSRPTFVAVTGDAGIDFIHENGAFGSKYLPETMGSEVAWIDYDADGYPDLFLVNGTQFRLAPDERPATQALYRNLGNGRFEDRTVAANLAIALHGMGVAVGDVDRDGHDDLFVSALRGDRLFRNRGDGSFEDIGDGAGLGSAGFSASASFLDYDRDGWLDLVLTRYVDWSEDSDLFCTLDGASKSYCTPETYAGVSNRLYRNQGDGTFEDVTDRSGVGGHVGKSLGVVILDHDLDGWLDIAISNDTMPNFLFRNNGDGTFSEIALEVGMALGEGGESRAGMGIDAGDYDGSGRESVVIGNFSAEMVGLFTNRGLGRYRDDAAVAGVGAPSLWTLAFGTLFFDYDLDGRLDLFVANGHVEPDVRAFLPNVQYAQPAHLFRNAGGGRFVEVSDDSADLIIPMVGRGAAYADFDLDGDLDLVVTTNGGPVQLLRNEGGNARNWLRVTLRGRSSNTDAFGALLELTVDDRVLMRRVPASSSYLSQSEKSVTFGLGDGSAGRLEISWPSGRRQTIDGLPTNAAVRIIEGEPSFRPSS